MKYEVPMFAFIFLCIASPAPAFPSSFSGKWEKDDKSVSGAIRIRINSADESSVQGVIEIDGTDHCKEPVDFRGTLKEKKLVVESVAKIVCGWGGKLLGEVNSLPDGYGGNFKYVYLGGVWASGTFRLTPEK